MDKQYQRYDIIIFGATGFTGQFVIEEVAKAAKREEEEGAAPLKWAVAGRNELKLEESLKSAQNVLGFDLTNIGLIIANVVDKKSIDEMTKQANIILNCVGPYHLYGKTIVESCIHYGASQLDLSGEPQYMNEIYQYDKEARNAGVHIVNSCGYDCIPIDIGLCYLSKQFPGTLNSAQGFYTVKGKMAALHTGTMESNVLAMSNLKGSDSNRKKISPKAIYPLSKHYGLHKNRELGLWSVPFPMGEEHIKQTQQHVALETNRPFVQYQGFLAHESSLKLVLVVIGAAYFFCMAFFSLTRNLLLKYPNNLTAGVFSKQGPTRESLEKCGFSVTMIGKGWKNPSEFTDGHDCPPNHKMILEITGPDPGYRATAIMMVACGMTLLRERENCSESGGIVSPGAAFYKTNIVQRLIKGGIAFKIKDVS